MAKGLIKMDSEKVDFFLAPHFIEKARIDDGLSEEVVRSIVCERDYEKALQTEFLKYQRFIDLNARLRGLAKRTAVLNAHGDYDEEKGRWMYRLDGEKNVPVQRWINQNDGNYELLILWVCNPDHSEIHSKKSCIVVPDANFSIMAKDNGLVNVELYVPGIGYVDDYTADAKFQDLERRLK